jgi:hypothetical protein
MSVILSTSSFTRIYATLKRRGLIWMVKSVKLALDLERMIVKDLIDEIVKDLTVQAITTTTTTQLIDEAAAAATR